MSNVFSNNLKDAPALVEIFRGTTVVGQPIVETVHHGLILVTSGDEHSLISIGDTKTMVHTRSCAKPLQALPLFRHGLFDGRPSLLTLADVALMMSSHAGASIHTSRVAELLTANGLDESSLRCGAHPPQDEATRKDLQRRHLLPSPLHNNCSGKHIGMLLVCLKQGFDIHSYEDPHHPLQQEIKKLVADFADLQPSDLSYGIDGCSLPTWALPLEKLALIYARLAYWQEHLPRDRPHWLKMALKKMWEAAVKAPDYLAGPDQFDTELIKRSGGQIFSKIGADGIHALAALPCAQYPTGLGIAIKIADGDARKDMRPLVIKHTLTKLGLWPAHPALESFMPSFQNFRGLNTGGAKLLF